MVSPVGIAGKRRKAARGSTNFRRYDATNRLGDRPTNVSVEAAGPAVGSLLVVIRGDVDRGPDGRGREHPLQRLGVGHASHLGLLLAHDADQARHDRRVRLTARRLHLGELDLLRVLFQVGCGCK